MPNRAIQRLFQSYKAALNESRQPLKNRRAITSITYCRTRDMGVSYYACPDCQEQWEQYHSCRHRSCYVCAQKHRKEWIEAQKQRLLDVPHFHVIFTLPHEYLPLWRYNEGLFARLLFRASQEALQELLADKKYGGIRPGILMALHTWGRQLTLHPHTHCLVTAGGLMKSGEWKGVGDYLLPGAVLRRYYRGKVQALLKDAADDKGLVLPPDLSVEDFWRQHRSLYRKEWSVRVEERYAHGRGVMLYLARYCKGGPLRPEQIKRWDGQRLEMSYLSHRDKRIKQQKLTPWQMIQRLLQHVPAKGVHTVRYYGLYAPAARKRHQRMLAQHGNLAGVKVRCTAPVEQVLLCCNACGAHAELLGRPWRREAKGISFIKEDGAPAVSDYVQQGVERDLERGSIGDSS